MYTYNIYIYYNIYITSYIIYKRARALFFPPEKSPMPGLGFIFCRSLSLGVHILQISELLILLPQNYCSYYYLKSRPCLRWGSYSADL